MTNRNLGKLATVGVLLAVLVLIANAWASYANARHLVEKEAWVRHTQTVLQELANVEAAASDAASAQQAALLTENNMALVPYVDATNRVEAHLTELQGLVNDNPSQKARLAELRKRLRHVWDTLGGAIATRRSGGAATPSLADLVGQSRAALDAARHDIDSMRQEEHALLEQRTAQSRASYTRALGTFTLATVIAIAMVGLAYFLIRHDQAVRTESLRQRNRLENYNRMLIDSTGEGIFGIDVNGACTFVNASGAKMLGL